MGWCQIHISLAVGLGGAVAEVSLDESEVAVCLLGGVVHWKYGCSTWDLQRRGYQGQSRGSLDQSIMVLEGGSHWWIGRLRLLTGVINFYLIISDYHCISRYLMFHILKLKVMLFHFAGVLKCISSRMMSDDYIILISFCRSFDACSKQNNVGWYRWTWGIY